MSQNSENTVVIKFNSKNEKEKLKCIGVNNYCPFDGSVFNLTHGQYCKYCLYMISSHDPQIKKLFIKTKEIEVVNYVCHKHKDYGKWYHDTLIKASNNNDSKRSIDLRILINDVMLCIEIDQDQHKSYKLINEIKRYTEFINNNNYKYIFIRYNPDKYTTDDVIHNPEKEIRFVALSNEVAKQFTLIKNNKIDKKLDIIYLFYDGYKINDQTNVANNYPNKQNQCLKCNKLFKFAHDLERHLKRKIPCAKDEKNVYFKNNRICSYCNNEYTRSDSLKRHLETCQAKINNDEKIQKEAEKDLLVVNLLKEIQEMKADIQKKDEEIEQMRAEQQKRDKEMQKIIKNEQQKKDKMLDKLLNKKDKEIDNIKKKIQDEIQNEIIKIKEEMKNSYIEQSKMMTNYDVHFDNKLNAYENEDISYISFDDYKQIMYKGSDMLLCLIQYIHFNKNKPENHNIYIKNITHNYASIYDGKQWILKDRDEVLYQIIKNNMKLLNDKIKEFSNRLDTETILIFQKLISELNFVKLKKDLKFLLYNNMKLTKAEMGLEIDLIDDNNVAINNKKKSILESLMI